MRQTTISVPLEVKPESCSQLAALIELVKRREDTGEGGFPQNFARITAAVPAAHFMSMSIFPASEYDPLFIIEANFDGPVGGFWGQMEALLGEDLRAMLRCCKRPLDPNGPLYDAVTAADSHAPVAPYLEARTQRPSVFHHGNRGMTRDRILREQALFVALREQLDTADAPAYQKLTPDALRTALRETLLKLPGFAWLGEPSPQRITFNERCLDFLRLQWFAVLVLLALSAPGLILAALTPTRTYLWLIAVAGIVVISLIFRNLRGLPGTEIATTFRLFPIILSKAWLLATVVAVYVVLAIVVLDPVVSAATLFLHVVQGERMRNVVHQHLMQYWPEARAVLLGLLSLVVSLPLMILMLRYNEKRDSSHDAPRLDERMYREMIAREDWVAQNHMGSVVLIKPGILRSIVIRAGHLGLGLLLRVIATDGYLGSMRTVHFAHWAFLNNGSRLLFFSNFDHSWGSYLDDFIEKAHVGLTLAWGCGVGFPPTRFLIYDGAGHGRQFKDWALASRAVSRFWYSAYRDLTVDQIERNARIADGLSQISLSREKSVTWAQNL